MRNIIIMITLKVIFFSFLRSVTRMLVLLLPRRGITTLDRDSLAITSSLEALGVKVSVI